MNCGGVGGDDEIMSKKCSVNYFLLVCWVTTPPLISIKEAEDELQFSRRDTALWP